MPQAYVTPPMPVAGASLLKRRPGDHETPRRERRKPDTAKPHAAAASNPLSLQEIPVEALGQHQDTIEDLAHEHRAMGPRAAGVKVTPPAVRHNLLT